MRKSGNFHTFLYSVKTQEMYCNQHLHIFFCSDAQEKLVILSNFSKLKLHN